MTIKYLHSVHEYIIIVKNQCIVPVLIELQYKDIKLKYLCPIITFKLIYMNKAKAILAHVLITLDTKV